MDAFSKAALAGALALALAGCGAAGTDSAGGSSSSAGAGPSSASSSSESSTSIANPIEDFDNLPDAAARAGIDMVAPETAKGLAATAYECIPGEFVQVIYGDAEAGTAVSVRKGADEQDVSGVYETYDSTDTVVVNGTTITCQGNGGSISLATWVANGHSFSIYDAGDGMTFDDVYAIFSEVG